MEQLPIDPSLPEKLLHLTSSAELVDGTGRVVAVVHPRFDPTKYELLGLDISEEELQRRSQPGRKTYTTEEVLAKLRALG